ncbi:fatty acid--CoA ligase [Trebonia kvetii]|uniref:Fatty acid--CoA ligase n=1 Tax=Trebonia kvetii TaxID=2480626 RepID=A0A6P2BW69_9ACTN|nr:AMP-binding protein [Trebonia kvetii]TVZ03379.1 fatty acid--CoA ligase [Trebonia kvetii]
MLSLVHVLEWRAAVQPDLVAVSDDRGAELSYAALLNTVEASAGAFAAAGVGPGDVVPVIARNQAGWVTAVLGLIRAGALPAAVNWRLAAPEVTALLELMRPGVVVTDDDCAALAAAGAAPLGVRLLPGLGGGGQALPPARPADRLRGAEPALLLHTSGTTGRPKLVPLTHDQLIGAVTFMSLEVPEAAPGARHLSALPLFHVAGLANLVYVLFTGGHLHLLGGFDPAGYVDELASRRIQLTQLVPTLIAAVTAEVSSRAQRPDLSNLIEIVYGASPIRPDALERAVTVLGCRFRQNYASTETGPLPISSLSPRDHDPARGRLATAGRPSLGWEVRLGDLGEIQVCGAEPLPGYWNDAEATAATLTPDGFYRTGDVGTLDADGFITIVERLKDMVITGGENVYPAEVEAVLAGHPAVADIAVIGIPDARRGETVHAVVVAGPGLDTDELLSFARERLAGYKCPTGVTVVEELPRNATGKVLRAELRGPFWAGQDRRVS